MPLNKVKQGSNMYQFLNDNNNRGYTWNVIKGKCPHDCVYCHMKKYPQPELHFDEKELKTDLGSGNTIFVGSSCDMWAEDISIWLISSIISHCKKYNNRYLFQSKNPERFQSIGKFPPKTILGTTIETNRHFDFISKAPKIEERRHAIQELNYPLMISIEPIMDFDLKEMVRWMQEIKPQFVSIGANTNFKVKLPEPSPEKVKALIQGLKEFTEVKIKKNLNRILGEI